MPLRLLGSQRVINGKLFLGEFSAEELAQEFDTPLYVVDGEEFRQTIRRFVKTLSDIYPNSCTVYAAKANSALGVLQIAESEKLYVDVASEGELEAAIRAGFPPKRIYLHGNNKSERELTRAVEIGIKAIVLDNFYEIEKLANICKNKTKITDVIVRCAPGVDPETHEAISTGQEDTKFGFNIADGSAERAVKEILRHPSMRLIGFHCHVGSQLLDSKAHRAAGERLARFAISLRKEIGDIEEINLGGGLGIRYTEEDNPEPVEVFLKNSIEATLAPFENAKTLPKICFEPGRFLIGEAGTTLYRVGVIKTVPISEKRKTRTYVVVDGGLADNPRPQLYNARYIAINATRADKEHDAPFRIAGRHCETDTLIPEAKLPETTTVGDVIAVQCTGAYNFSMSSNYNRYPRPAMIIIEGKEKRLAVKRETLDDLFRNEMIQERVGR
ncbi:MAG TPA: diaminopimelate decarboxylase [Fimbriimonadales bacterium]|nr:diaminopimelate decarboxylase [Fimbriimonadales bacterium]